MQNRTNVKSLTIYYLLLLNGTNRDNKIYLFIFHKYMHTQTHTHTQNFTILEPNLIKRKIVQYGINTGTK